MTLYIIVLLFLEGPTSAFIFLDTGVIAWKNVNDWKLFVKFVMITRLCKCQFVYNIFKIWYFGTTNVVLLCIESEILTIYLFLLHAICIVIRGD